MQLPRIAPVHVALSLALLTPACGSAERALWGIAGATLYGAQAKGAEIEQVYYLGVLDPLEQVPPTIYRVRVRGQASLLSKTRFASGWVPAPLVDSLSSNISFDSTSGKVQITKDDGRLASRMPIGRNMVLFGPEGTRPAPEDHRLVIVMGSDPNEYFESMDNAIGAINEVGVEQRNLDLTRLLLEAHVQLRDDERQLESLKSSVDEALKANTTEEVAG